MKRAAPLLIAILLGALATAIGMGIFLKLANDDRARLGEEIGRARDEATQALADKERIANEANEKVAAANDEVVRAQMVLQSLEEEQKLLTTAVQLFKPPAREVRGWSPVTSYALRVNVMLPPRTFIETNDARALTSVLGTAAATGTADNRWFSVMPYDPRVEQELQASFSTSTARSYLVNGRLITGNVGVLAGNEAFALFRVRQTASSTHLLWMKNPGTLGTGDGFARLLGTMTFAE